MIYTTLRAIRFHEPCEGGWKTLLKHLGKTDADCEPLPLTTILDSNSLDDTLWCLRTVPEHDKLWRLYAVWCARQVQHLMKDERIIAALDVAERHAYGQATDEKLAEACAAVTDIVRDDVALCDGQYAAWIAVQNTVLATADGVAQASCVAQNAAWAAVRAAVLAAAGGDAGRGAARDSAVAAQKNKLREIFISGKWI